MTHLSVLPKILICLPPLNLNYMDTANSHSLHLHQKELGYYGIFMARYKMRDPIKRVWWYMLQKQTVFQKD